MNALIKLATATFFSIALIASSTAADRGTKPEAVALVQKAIAYFKANGKEKAFAEINNKSGQFVDRDMYVVNTDGKAFGEELRSMVKSGNPVTKQIESKTTYVEPVGDMGFAVGIYKL